MQWAISLIVVGFAIYWIYQFVQFMSFEDELFPGRYDKLIWAVVFLLAPPLAPFAFHMWKSARRAEVDARH